MRKIKLDLRCRIVGPHRGGFVVLLQTTEPFWNDCRAKNNRPRNVCAWTVSRLSSGTQPEQGLRFRDLVHWNGSGDDHHSRGLP